MSYTTKGIRDAQRGELAARDLSKFARRYYSGTDGVSILQDSDGVYTLKLFDDEYTFNSFQELDDMLAECYFNTLEGKLIREWKDIVSYMNDDIREQVHAELAPCTEQEFLDRYLELDPEFDELLRTEFNEIWQEL